MAFLLFFFLRAAIVLHRNTLLMQLILHNAPITKFYILRNFHLLSFSMTSLLRKNFTKNCNEFLFPSNKILSKSLPEESRVLTRLHFFYLLLVFYLIIKFSRNQNLCSENMKDNFYKTITTN